MSDHAMDMVGAKEPFVLPIDYSRLEHARLRLVPIEQDFHRFGTGMVEAFQQQPSMMNYVSYPPMKDVSDYYQYWQLRMSDAKVQIFAILLKAGTVTKTDAVTGEKHEFQVEDGTFAGVTGLIDGNREWASVEVAHVFTLPAFQRTSVISTAHALLLKHLLDPVPEDIGLRRVQWYAHQLNLASVGLAKRLGFQQEGVIRWERPVRDDRAGVVEEGMPALTKQGDRLGPGRHSVVLGLCWDDWRDGGRQRILDVLAM
ncbi:hypothetical protein B9Z65_1222 [Elsinoe australis]|uniref:N-acetyltransferase domain-containing protein n=1 Tax=Elsinoe australis TaxID=40998 RepID=A0A2P7YPZ0_9PEZI|nr:hypothetical protein B9Z65_1222 [Elsinoe australis]